MRFMQVEFPERCGWGFESMKIWGVRIEGRVRVEVGCMRCGEVLWEREEQDGG